MIAWMIFLNPMVLGFNTELWLLLPLCAAVAIVYKTIRVDDLRHLAREIVALIAYMVVGLVALSVVLWLIHEYWG
jgi:hypothetical protein